MVGLSLGGLSLGLASSTGGGFSLDAFMAATDGAVFHVYSAAGAIEPVDHVAAVLATEGLQYVPDEPI